MAKIIVIYVFADPLLCTKCNFGLIHYSLDLIDMIDFVDLISLISLIKFIDLINLIDWIYLIG